MEEKTGRSSPDYGNWVPKRLLGLCAAVFFISAALLAASFLPCVRTSAALRAALWALRAVLAALCCLAAISFKILYRAHRDFSYNGGRLSDKILDYVVENLRWDGRGKILDIGCGGGALAVKIAKRFPEAEVTGLDYWGLKWDYCKEQCEKNAAIEGVGERIKFIRGDAAELPFKDGEFDAAVSNFVFHEVGSQPDKKLLVKEALRVVKPGGGFVFHDLFYRAGTYGSTSALEEYLRELGAADIRMKKTAGEIDMPEYLRGKIFLATGGMIYGTK